MRNGFFRIWLRRPWTGPRQSPPIERSEGKKSLERHGHVAEGHQEARAFTCGISATSKHISQGQVTWEWNQPGGGIHGRTAVWADAKMVGFEFEAAQAEGDRFGGVGWFQGFTWPWIRLHRAGEEPLEDRCDEDSGCRHDRDLSLRFHEARKSAYRWELKCGGRGTHIPQAIGRSRGTAVDKRSPATAAWSGGFPWRLRRAGSGASRRRASPGPSPRGCPGRRSPP